MKSIKNYPSTLCIIWVFILFNMVYADILGMLKPGYLDQLEQINKTLSEEVVLGFALLMEVPIIMILFSAFLKKRVNIIVNVFGASISILWVILPAFFSSMGTTPLSYVFFASVEVVTMLFIGWCAWGWSEEEELYTN